MLSNITLLSDTHNSIELIHARLSLTIAAILLAGIGEWVVYLKEAFSLSDFMIFCISVIFQKYQLR